jgi:hypothetical protein
MRTLIAIGDYLLRTAKRETRRRGRTLGRLVEEALRRAFSRPAGPTATPDVPILHGTGGVRPGIDVASNRALLEALDEGRPVQRLR